MESHEQDHYSKGYSESSFWEKISKFASKAGIKVTYAALLLYYVLQKSSTPIWVKGAIIGALGYFISPIDAIPDIIPVAGYGDDMGTLAAALATAAIYVDEEVKTKAKNKLRDWFGEYDEDVLEDIDEKMQK